MKGVKKLYETKTTNLPTNQPAYYYGQDDGNVYVIYSTPYTTPSKKEKKLEWHFARVKSFKFDSQTGELVKDGKELREGVFGGYPDLDYPGIDKDLKTIKTIKNFKSIVIEQVEERFFKHADLKMVRTK